MNELTTLPLPTQALFICAWQLAGDGWWVDEGYLARVKGGRVGYETATASHTGLTVCLRRTSGLRKIVRYVAWHTPMEVVRSKKVT